MMTDFYNQIQGQNILVTGGTGSIGSEIVKKLLSGNPKSVRIFARDEFKHFDLRKHLEHYFTDAPFEHVIGDVRDAKRVNEAMQDVDIVFHAAGLKHVTFAEENPEEAIKTNVYGTQNIVDAALTHNIEKVVAISTDKAVYPNTTMGTTKLLMERVILGAKAKLTNARTKLSIVRFGNVLGSRGSVLPIWIDQIKRGEPITITDKNMRRFYMHIPEAVDLVFYAFTIMHGQEIIVLKMPEISIYELAQKTIAEHAEGKKIEIRYIGMKEREKLEEQLYTEEERKLMYENDKFYIILPNSIVYKERIGLYE